MQYKELEGIGLTKSEILVYISLLKTGQSSTSKIVKEAKISSGKIYEILNKLIEKGLVSYILKNNVKYFSASNPSKIKEYIEKKKSELEKKEKEIITLIPQLKKIKDFKKKEYSAEIYLGFNGFKTAIISFSESLSKKSEMLSLGGSGIRKSTINIIWKKVTNILNSKKIKSRVLITDVSKESKNELKEYKKYYSRFTYKFLPGFHLAPILIGEDSTLIINFEELSVIVIKSSTIAKQFKFFFESLWKISKK